VNDGLRQLASHVVVRSGIAAIGRRSSRRSGAFVLYGHRVAADDDGYLQGLAPAWLEEQLRYLTRHYEVISLQTLVKCFEQGRPVPDRSVVLTFDDGFRDNVEVALPLLHRVGACATFFVVTGSLTNGSLPWSQRLGYVFQRTEENELMHAVVGPTPLSTSDPVHRRRAYAVVKSSIAALPRSDRDRIIEEVAHQLGVEPPVDRMMTWDHARAALSAGHEIGAHTYSHALLGQVSEDEAEWEMQRSLDDVRSRLGVDSPHFCFPAGSISPRTSARVRALGFRSSFLPGQPHRLNQVGVGDQYTLARVGLPNAGAVVLEAELDGPFQSLRLLLRGARA
jgi:peptidoglycan/xylan/chitin deacetylase (PgdA/CDA1 family)